MGVQSLQRMGARISRQAAVCAAGFVLTLLGRGCSLQKHGELESFEANDGSAPAADGAGATAGGSAAGQSGSSAAGGFDASVEAAAGQSVAEIFSKFGEAEFRQKERQIIARLLDGGPCVLSLGGGAFMDEATRARIKDKAFSVWIKVDREILIKRVMKTGHRPLLNGENPEEKLGQLLAKREVVYAGADLIVPCDDRPVTQNARVILTAIQAALKSQTA